MPANKRCRSFDFNPSDFMNDTNVIVMGLESRGVYIGLLCAAWDMDHPGVLPAQDEALARLARCTPEEWHRSKHAVSRCFDTSDGRWIQRRMVREHEAQTRRVKRRSTSGKLGNQVRWHQQDKSHCDPIAIPSSLLPSFPPKEKEKQERPTIGPSSRCLARLKIRFPDLDLPVIEAKMLARHSVNPYKNLDRAMIDWCKIAESKGWDHQHRPEVSQWDRYPDPRAK